MENTVISDTKIRVTWGNRTNISKFLFFFSTFNNNLCFSGDFPDALMVKNLPAMQETQAPSLGQEDPLETGKATHSSIPAWRIPRTEEPGGQQSRRLKRVRHN